MYSFLHINRNSIFLTLVMLFIGIAPSLGQYLRPEFDPSEFAEILKINAQVSEHPSLVTKIPTPKAAVKVYESEEMGLKNKWELWRQNPHTMVIALRGSTTETESWLANFFAAQIPAKGTIRISKQQEWTYQFAQHPKAAVHAGYVFSTYFLLNDILPRIDSVYKAGVKDFIITGHSQGGGLSYLVSAALIQLQKKGQVPTDIRFKVYTSASPKPGNLYFAYDYEQYMGSGWSQHIVNSEDWVPQSPFTVQTFEDLPEVSPLMLLESAVKKQSFIKRLFIKGIYKKVTKPSINAVKTYQKYLGTFMGKQIQKHYPEFEIPSFADGNEYVRTSRQVVFIPSGDYYKEFDILKNKDQFMLHHSTIAYYYLLRDLYKVD